uniref:Uncharacterized protein n=1 Tax=Arundo donax TaxID=35708 RepID=A0A0A9FB93_ARUDO
MLVEPFASHCGYLCTSRQTFFEECTGCMYIYHRRWDHRDTDLGCSMCVSRYYCSYW